MPMFGVPEIAFIFLMLIGWLIPLVVFVWALVTLYRMRVGIEAMRTSLERIEQHMQRR